MSYTAARLQMAHDMRKARLMGMDGWLLDYVERELRAADKHFEKSKRGAGPMEKDARHELQVLARVELKTLHDMVKAFIAQAVASAWKVNKIALRSEPKASA
jgi:hypothetical protein